ALAAGGGVGVGGGDSRGRPVARADLAEMSAVDMFVEQVHDLADGHARVVAVEEVEVDHIDAQPLEALGDVAGDHFRREMMVGALTPSCAIIPCSIESPRAKEVR